MAKMIMLDPDYPAMFTTNIDTGLYFERGKPRPVTDEQAEKLLAVHDMPYFEGTEEDVQRLSKVHGAPRIGTPRPNLGKRKNPEFIEVTDSADGQKPASASVAATDSKSAASVTPSA